MLHTLRFSLQNAVCFIMLPFLVPVLFTFYIQGVLKFKCKTPMPKVNSIWALFKWSVSHIGHFSTDEVSPVLICWRLLIHRASADAVSKIKLRPCRKSNMAVPV